MFWRDMKMAWRVAINARGATVATIAVLSLGVGVTSSLFSLVYAVLLEPLPYRDPDRVVVVSVQRPQSPGALGRSSYVLTGAEIRNVQSVASDVFESVAIFEPWSSNVQGRQTLYTAGGSERLYGTCVSENFFEVLGVGAASGRTFQSGDAPDQTIVISHGLWTRLFAQDRQVVGKQLLLDGFSKTIVGVLPSGVSFTYPRETDFWCLRKPQLHSMSLEYQVVARLKRGVTIRQATQSLTRLSGMTRESGFDPRSTFTIRAMKDWVTGDAQPLWMTAVAAALLFLTAVGSAALLLVGRTMRRLPDLATHVLLGATQRRMLWQNVLDTGLIGALGAVLGSAICLALQPILAWIVPDAMPRGNQHAVNVPVLLFAAGIGVVMSVVGSVSVHMAGTNLHVAAAVAQVGRGVTLPPRFVQLRAALLVLQSASTVALLALAGLLLHSAWNLSKVDLGFVADDQVIVQTRLFENPVSRAESASRLSSEQGMLEQAFHLRQELQRRMTAIPGVREVATASTVPFGPFDQKTWVPQSRSAPLLPGVRVTANVRYVSPNFFDVLGIRLLQGRAFSEEDIKGAPRVAVVSASLARALFGEAVPRGRTLHWGDAYRVVGVVDDVRWKRPQEEPEPAFYLPVNQNEHIVITLILRTGLPLQSIAASTRAVTASIDPYQPVDAVQSLARSVESATAEGDFVRRTSVAFAVFAIILGMTGIVAAIEVALMERRREIGIRMALGGRPAAVQWAVIRKGFLPTLLGMLAGLMFALSIARLLRPQLFEVRPAEPTTYVLVAAGFIVTALLASWLPARRAVRIDPAICLRQM